jgi:hypothetical protein
MAAWQTDFRFRVAADDLPDDYKARFGAVLPVNPSWSPDIELRGTEQSDRIEVTRDLGAPPEVFCRLDLREWKPGLYGRFIECLGRIGGRLETASGETVPLEQAAFERVLRSSSAARFVENPRGFLDTLTGDDSRA